MNDAPRTASYQCLMRRFLAAPDALAKETVLLEADEWLRRLRQAESISLDEILGLHQHAQASLALEADDTLRQQLACGDSMPLMLAMLLPIQIDEQACAQRRWRQEHAKLATAFEQTEDLVLVLDANGQIDYLNPAFERATGWRLIDARTHAAQIWTTPPPAHGTQHVESSLLCADQRRFDVMWSVSAVIDQDGWLSCHVCIGRDVTRVRQMEEELRRHDKLRAVAALAAGVAHDFNNLLGTIIGQAELGQALAEAGIGVTPQFDCILQACQRAAALVHELLNFSHETPTRLHPLALAGTLRRCETLLAASLPRGVHLRLQIDADPVVMADEPQIEQVLLNLVKNAGYAMRINGGLVTLTLDTIALDDDLSGARLRVIDQGEGIPADVMPRIFEPFVTTKPVDEGTGLGLAAAHGIVSRHGGTITVRSQPWTETVFEIMLPSLPRI